MGLQVRLIVSPFQGWATLPSLTQGGTLRLRRGACPGLIYFGLSGQRADGELEFGTSILANAISEYATP